MTTLTGRQSMKQSTIRDFLFFAAVVLLIIFMAIVVALFAFRLVFDGVWIIFDGVWIVPEIAGTEDLTGFMLGFLQVLFAFFTLLVAIGSMFGFIFIKNSSIVAAERVAEKAAEKVAKIEAEKIIRTIVENSLLKKISNPSLSKEEAEKIVRLITEESLSERKDSDNINISNPRLFKTDDQKGGSK